MNVLKKLKIGHKINLLIVSVIILTAVSVSIIVNTQVKSGLKDSAVEKAKSDLALSYRYIDEKYPGDWEIKGGSLFKGDTKLNENYEIVDEIGELTHDTVTIFQGDTRISTNVQKDGKRAVGTTVSQEVNETVLKNGKVFLGEANVVGKDYQTAYMPIKNSSGEIIGIYYVGASEEFIQATLGSFNKVYFGALAVIILITNLIGIWFARRIRKRLTVIAEVLEQAGEGDFTADIRDHSQDEIGVIAASYQNMKQKLGSLITEVTTTSESVASASEQLSASADQTTSATEQVASAIEQIAGSAENQTSGVEKNTFAIEEVSAGITKIAESTHKVFEFANSTAEHAETGETFVKQTVDQMNTIDRAVIESNESIKSLSERSKEIGQISEVISGISEQTNLLALNAAIEAARAGEHGKGFAVVADEVRKLAEQSKLSAKQISDLIAAIQQDTERSVTTMADVSDNVKNGMEIAGETAGKFKGIVGGMREIAPQIEEVSATAQQMAASVQELSLSAAELSAIARENSASSQEVAASTEEQLASMEEITSSADALSQMAEELQEVVRRFKI
ncbi:methyl-accepting chemotaxis protein [Bacillus marinisedimentorum]|uniref:methyl-accepting chemotaxis protein n=1 Tax=Bacillus marinisedimentorum TaxID=1821260 RepID=UPI0007E1F84D|nr:methyl-accepting chemotaxis protein [Bacillus marinisedimentorum]